MKAFIRHMLREALDYQGHKIPVGNIFFNDNLHASGYASDIMKHIDIYQSDEQYESNPIESVDVKKIVPTQKFVTKDNLKDVKGIVGQDNTGAYLVEYGGMYYIIDGHHRIATMIINGYDHVNAFVQHVS